VSSGKSLERSQAQRWNSGIVSLLDPEHYTAVEGIWDELERELGLHGVKVTPWPNISYQLGDYDLEILPGILEKLAGATSRFEIQTTGLGVFSGLQPVLYVPVVRTTELSEFQRLLWTAVGTACRNASDDYWVSNWMPHVTLAAGDLDASNVADAIKLLAARRFDWRMTIDNLAYIDAGYEGKELRLRYDLTG
jgi:2'-5' RNA ligase superfamily